MQLQLKKSIALRFVVYVASLVACIIGIVVIAAFLYSKQKAEEDLVSKGNIMLKTSVSQSFSALWNLDSDSAQQLVKNLSNDKDFSFAILLDQNNKVFSKHFKDKALERQFIKKVLSHKKKTSIIADSDKYIAFETIPDLETPDSKTVVGKLVIALSRARYTQKRIVESYVIIGGGCFFLVLLSGAVYLISMGFVRPIHNITDEMTRLSSGDLGVEVSALTREDEIGKIALALQIFKDNSIEKKKMEQREKEESERKSQRASKIDDLILKFEKETSNFMNLFEQASGKLDETAEKLSTSARLSNDEAENAKAKAEISSTNNRNIEQATEQLFVTLTEVSEQIDEANGLTKNASECAKVSSEEVSALLLVSEKIGQIFENHYGYSGTD